MFVSIKSSLLVLWFQNNQNVSHFFQETIDLFVANDIRYGMYTA